MPFTPPPLDSHEGPAKDSFVPPPLDSHEGVAAPEGKSLSGFAGNLVDSAGNFVGGVINSLNPYNLPATAKGLLNLATGASAHMSRTTKYFPEATATADAFGQNLKNRYGSLAALGNTAYQDPIGVLADASTVAAGTGALLKGAGALAKLPELTRAGELATATASATDPMKIPGRLGALISPEAKQHAAEFLYQGALKPTKAAGNAQDLVQTALREEIPLGYFNRQAALQKTNAAIDDIQKTVNGTIQQGAAQGMTVDPAAIPPYLDRSRAQFQNQVNPLADLEAIDKAQNEFLVAKGNLGKYPGVTTPQGVPVSAVDPISIDEAQKIKSGTYTQLRKKYGELSSASNEAQKDLARGLKEEIYNQFPQLREMGKREGSLIELEGALEDYARRAGNHDVVGIGTPIAGALGGSVGGPKFAALAAMAKAAIDNHGVKSRLAIALSRSAKGSSASRIPGALTPIVRLDPNNLMGPGILLSPEDQQK